MLRVYTVTDFKAWLARANAGERVVYAVRDYGEGPVRRKPNFSAKTDARNPRSMADSEELFVAAKAASDKGEVILTRKRITTSSEFECYAQRTAAPLRGIAQFHPSVAPRRVSQERCDALIAESKRRVEVLERPARIRRRARWRA